MRWKMPNVAVVAVAVAALLLVTAETVLAAGGGGGGGSGGGGGGGGGGGRQRGAATAAADRQEDFDNGDDESPQTPAAVQCSNCLGHEGIKSLSIELIKASILNKLGMQRPPEFGGRLPPRVPTDLPPLQDLMRKYNNDHSGSVVVLPHIRHKSHHFDDSVTDMQSDEATGYSTTASADNSNSYNVGNADDDDDDYHVKTHKLIAFAQPHPTLHQKLRGHYPIYFTFSEQTGQQRITEAILWLYKKRLDVVIDDPVVMLDVYRINPITFHQSYVSSIKHIINTTEPGWVPIDIQRRMSDWFKSTDGPKNLTLVVHSYYLRQNTSHLKPPYVTDARKREDMTEIPYLEVHTREDRRSRARRNAASGLTCNETSTETRCCRFPLTVDFEEFGWHWIIAPKRYVANYCSGACDPMLFPKYPHTHLVQMTKFGTGPCCAPRKMSAISMLYYDPDFNIIYGMLPGMVVDRCGCS
ncbi:growth/differentiation factor 8-like isoform X2 [Rhopalosiphum maidis]|uniref:growth/differentiation factor 8-like isoform X2 n=1 Tax=Rhopalosiphum maidis TaxID=43146 RepID=UPI000EFEBDDF|nr:growth/differentiation factor 8-like isoform X2 [Rhopalosiphum maidis]